MDRHGNNMFNRQVGHINMRIVSVHIIPFIEMFTIKYASIICTIGTVMNVPNT